MARLDWPVTGLGSLTVVADVQYTTLYLPDGTPLSVVVGSQLQATLLATGATTSPVTRTAGTSSSSTPAPDVRTPVATIWYSTPFGPQAIIDEHTQAEYARRDYPVITAAQAAAYYASGAQLPRGRLVPAAAVTPRQGGSAGGI